MCFRCLRLLIVDVNLSARLFWKALTGTESLKLREVRHLRRTSKDVLVFIPIILLLIAPLTPVGHVAIFAFIQKYFPDIFPSQLSTRRQELMLRYDEIKRQLRLSEKKNAFLEEEEQLLFTAQALEALRVRNNNNNNNNNNNDDDNNDNGNDNAGEKDGRASVPSSAPALNSSSSYPDTITTATTIETVPLVSGGDDQDKIDILHNDNDTTTTTNNNNSNASTERKKSNQLKPTKLPKKSSFKSSL